MKLECPRDFQTGIFGQCWCEICLQALPVTLTTVSSTERLITFRTKKCKICCLDNITKFSTITHHRKRKLLWDWPHTWRCSLRALHGHTASNRI